MADGGAAAILGDVAATQPQVSRREAAGTVVYESGGRPFVALTGVHTGRTPRDKFIVADAATEGTVDWNTINQRVSSQVFESLKFRMLANFQGREAFVTDCFAGADPEYRLSVRLVCRALDPCTSRTSSPSPAPTESTATRGPPFEEPARSTGCTSSSFDPTSFSSLSVQTTVPVTRAKII